MELSGRKKRILQAIVSDYIETAEPVGSRTIAKKHMMDLSPATIRNEMADLEEMGYLEQPHSSAGRVPSVMGYRVFVDNLMERYKLSVMETIKMQQVMNEKAKEFDKLIERASHVIASITNYATVAINAGKKKNSIKTIQIVPISRKETVLIIVTNEGIVKNRLVRLKEEITPEEASKLSARMTKMLGGLTLNQISLETINNIKNSFSELTELINDVVDFISDVIGEIDSRDVIVDGGVNLLKFPEYSNIEKAKEILEVLENKEKLQNMVSLPVSAGNKVNIIIGDEHNGIKLKDCSVVLCTYEFDGNEGTIGVIGPTRMDYARVVSAMEYLCEGMRMQLGEGEKKSEQGKEEDRPGG
ncbi:MAG: heat-inducible transcriptional repressor HrcA [Bacillota bacterium]|nr:heat-inducible transcriptional repressor HrcA [Bacillota bacterium]